MPPSWIVVACLTGRGLSHRTISTNCDLGNRNRTAVVCAFIGSIAGSEKRFLVRTLCFKMFLLNVLIWHNYLHVLVFEPRWRRKCQIENRFTDFFSNILEVKLQFRYCLTMVAFLSATSCLQRKAAFFYIRPIKYRKSCTDFNLKTYTYDKQLWKNSIFINKQMTILFLTKFNYPLSQRPILLTRPIDDN